MCKHCNMTITGGICWSSYQETGLFYYHDHCFREIHTKEELEAIGL